MDDTFNFNIIASLLQVFLPSSRIFVLYLATSLLLALFAFWQIEAAHRREHPHEVDANRPGFLRYVFDPRVWFHKSARQDYLFFAVNSVIYYGLIAQFLLSTHGMTDVFHATLINLVGERQDAVIGSVPALITYTIIAAVSFDFAVFIAHLLMHKSPVLWHFHKVHHSAEVLNPMTLFRMHPVDLFITGLFVAVISGASLAGLFYLTNEVPMPLTIFGLNVIVFVFYVLGYNLRHMEVWLSYPVWLSNILISPAQHQIHHSTDPKHFDKNMGLMFAFWDKLFGTLYVPRGREKLSYGISRSEPNPFASISDLYVKPFVWAAQTLRETVGSGGRRAVAYSGLLALLAVYTSVLQLQPAGDASAQRVYIADMTWTDVQGALDQGFDTVIIPTGGTEQGGPFVALGKHNFIVRETSEQIARRIGNTLVAPVMAYVPEGEISPPSGHMAYAGTISLPEPVFEQVIEAAARSMKQHGFTNILVLGDSGDSLAAQQRIVDRLSGEWADTDVRIGHMSDYYAANGQVEALLAKGYTRDEIGYHAGLRDMSELMFVAPDNVRGGSFDLKGKNPGFSGMATEASAAIGEEMIRLKVETGVGEARKYLIAWGRKVQTNDAVAEGSAIIDRMKTAATQ